MSAAITKPIPEMIKARIAYTVCGPSISRALRKGAKSEVIQFFKQLDLSPLCHCSRKEFDIWLNTETSKLEKKLKRFVKKPQGKPFGYARKLINLFLRDLTYDYRCRVHFGLGAATTWLEVPVDTHVAEGLQDNDETGLAPRWNHLYGLNRDEHSKYQNAASLVAKKYKLARVDLDLLYWPGVEDDVEEP